MKNKTILVDGSDSTTCMKLIHQLLAKGNRVVFAGEISQRSLKKMSEKHTRFFYAGMADSIGSIQNLFSKFQKSELQPSVLIHCVHDVPSSQGLVNGLNADFFQKIVRPLLFLELFKQHLPVHEIGDVHSFFFNEHHDVSHPQSFVFQDFFKKQDLSLLSFQLSVILSHHFYDRFPNEQNPFKIRPQLIKRKQYTNASFLKKMLLIRNWSEQFFALGSYIKNAEIKDLSATDTLLNLYPKEHIIKLMDVYLGLIFEHLDIRFDAKKVAINRIFDSE